MTNRDSIDISGKVVIILYDGNQLRRLEVPNIVTNAGDLFYAQRANQEVPDNLFHVGGLVLGLNGNAPSKTSIYSDITSIVPSSFKNLEPGYPLRNDQSPSNTGKGKNTITYKFKYLSNEVNSANMNRLAITVQNPNGSSQLLMYAIIPLISKSAGQILTVFVNHNFNGV